MRLLCAFLLLTASAAFSQSPAIHLCKPASAQEHTHRGLKTFVQDMQKKPMKLVNGTFLNEFQEPTAGVLIEVFRSNGALSSKEVSAATEDDSNSRVAACITDVTGRYRFDLPSGHYEIRASHKQWYTISALVFIDSENGKEKNMTLHVKDID